MEFTTTDNSEVITVNFGKRWSSHKPCKIQLSGGISRNIYQWIEEVGKFGNFNVALLV